MSDIVLADEKTKLFAALSGYSAALSRLTPEQVPAAFEMTDKLKKLSEEVRDRLREKLMTWVKENGSRITDKGSMAGEVGGFKVTMIPTKTGTDPKKLEALLRRKGLDPAVAMKPTMAWAVDTDKVQQAVGAGKLTQADVDNCQYDPSYRIGVQTNE